MQAVLCGVTALLLPVSVTYPCIRHFGHLNDIVVVDCSLAGYIAFAK